MEETNQYYVLTSFALLTTHVLFSKKTNFNIIELRYAIYGVYLNNTFISLNNTNVQ